MHNHFTVHEFPFSMDMHFNHLFASVLTEQATLHYDSSFLAGLITHQILIGNKLK